MERYAVKLLFQFRIGFVSHCKMRTCEEKIVLFQVDKIHDDIIQIANNRGQEDEFNYIDDNDEVVYYEFIGIVDICHLGIEVEEDEVWYDIKTLLNPMERKNKLLPTLDRLRKRIDFK